MKRELKDQLPHLMMMVGQQNRKAHPDEKGTESHVGLSKILICENRKAHPDEKGTESLEREGFSIYSSPRSQGSSR